MRKLLLIGQGSILAFMVLAIAACSIGLAAGPLGAVEIKRGAPIEIRALLSESVVPSVSPLIGTAMELAIRDYGPIHGHHVSVQTLDERCSGPGGRAAAEAVVADAAVVGVIGTLCSGAAVEASPILSAAGLSMISPANTSPVLTSDLAGNAGPHHHKGYNRVTDNDLIEASVVARFSYDELGLRRMVTIHDGDAYTSSIANAFAVEFARHGGAVPIVARVAKGQTDMAAVLARFEEAEPDGVFIPLFPSEAASLIQQAAKLRALEAATMIGGAAVLTTDVLALPESEASISRHPIPETAGTRTRRRGRALPTCWPRSRPPLARRQRPHTGRTAMTPRRCCSRPSSRFRPSMETRSRSIARRSAMRWVAPKTSRASSAR